MKKSFFNLADILTTAMAALAPWVCAASRDGAAVGAFIAPRELVQTVRRALHVEWNHRGAPSLKRFSAKMTVTPYSDGKMALHVDCAAAAAVATMMREKDKGAVPSELLKLMEAGEIVYVRGLRVGSPECLGSAHAAPNAFSWSLSEAERARRRACEAMPRGAHAAFRYAELFAGVGGFRIGLDALGGECVFASEVCKEARQTYYENFGATPIALAGDITEVDASALPPFDILTGGFPCQSFSRAGEQRGFEDPRGKLFFEVVRLLTCCSPKPRGFILENVKQICELDDGEALQVVLGALRHAGYSVCWKLLNSCHYGVPQNRERVYFCGVRSDLLDAPLEEVFKWPPALPKRCLVRDILEDFEEGVGAEKKERLAGHALTQEQWDKIIARNKRRSRAMRERGEDTPPAPNWRLVDPDGVSRTLMSSYMSFQLHSEFVRRPAPLSPRARAAQTVPPSTPPRFFTPREFARLQGFPGDFILDACTRRADGKVKGANKSSAMKKKRKRGGSGERALNGANRIYHQIGNAVSPPVVQAVARALLPLILKNTIAK